MSNDSRVNIKLTKSHVSQLKSDKKTIEVTLRLSSKYIFFVAIFNNLKAKAMLGY